MLALYIIHLMLKSDIVYLRRGGKLNCLRMQCCFAAGQVLNYTARLRYELNETWHEKCLFLSVTDFVQFNNKEPLKLLKKSIKIPIDVSTP